MHHIQLDSAIFQYFFASTRILEAQYCSTGKEVLPQLSTNLVQSKYYTVSQVKVFVIVIVQRSLLRCATAKRSSLAEGKSNRFMNFCNLEEGKMFEKKQSQWQTLAYLDYCTQCLPLVCLFTDVCTTLAEGGRYKGRRLFGLLHLYYDLFI